MARDRNKKYLVTKGAMLKKKWQAYVVACIRRDIGIKKAKCPVDIKYTFYEPNRKRDKGNVMSFADKIICDALQDARTIPNDNWSCIRNISMEFYVDADRPRIEVELIEVEE